MFVCASRRLAVFASLALLLAACQAKAPDGASAAAAPRARYTGSLPAPAPFQAQAITAAGPYVHPYTGLVFPERIGQLQRVDLIAATENRDDIAANYKIPGHEDYVATVLVFPIWNVINRPLDLADVPEACAEGYADARNRASERLYNPRLVKDEPLAKRRFGAAAFARVAAFDADGGYQLADFPIRSELYVQCGVQQVWVVQYRISYAAGLGTAAALTEDFLQGVPEQP